MLTRAFLSLQISKFSGGHAPRPPSGSRLRRSKLASSRSQVWLRPCKHDNQTRGGFGLACATGMYLPLSMWLLRNFKQEFLLNRTRLKCLRRNVSPARKLTLPLQKGDWTRWVTLLAEPTFCNLKGSPCFVKKCLKRCLFQGSSGRRVTLVLETNFLHISEAQILVNLYINFHSPADAHFFFSFFCSTMWKTEIKKIQWNPVDATSVGP